MRILKIIAIALLCGCTTISKPMASPLESYRPCVDDTKRQEARSAELQMIVESDQADRKDFFNKTSEELLELAKRDVEKRKRVGEIFGEGCFKAAADFSAAALVYQHGDRSDHYMQTYIWAKRAIELGDDTQKSLMAFGIDRYLVNTGHKQLFGSQAVTVDKANPLSCWCLQEVEKSFPDSLRVKYTNRALQDNYQWLKTLNLGKSCANTECKENLAPTPRGSVLGFW